MKGIIAIGLLFIPLYVIAVCVVFSSVTSEGIGRRAGEIYRGIQRGFEDGVKR